MDTYIPIETPKIAARKTFIVETLFKHNLVEYNNKQLLDINRSLINSSYLGTSNIGTKVVNLSNIEHVLRKTCQNKWSILFNVHVYYLFTTKTM